MSYPVGNIVHHPLGKDLEYMDSFDSDIYLQNIQPDNHRSHFASKLDY